MFLENDEKGIVVMISTPLKVFTRELTIPKSIATNLIVLALTDKKITNPDCKVVYFYTANCLLTLKSTYRAINAVVMAGALSSE